MAYVRLQLLLCIFITVYHSNRNVKAEYNHVIFAALYERDFYREFTSYLENTSKAHNPLIEVLDVLNRTQLHIEDIPRALNTRNCLMCRASAYSILQHYNRNSANNLANVLQNLCDLLTTASFNVCHGSIQVYLPVIEYVLEKRSTVLTSDFVCGVYLQEHNCAVNNSLIDFTIETGEPVLKGPKEHQVSDTSSELTILHLSDFHYDPYYNEGNYSECTDDVCCRNTSQAINNSNARAGKWGDYNYCDSPDYLIENLCEQITNQHKNIDWIYYTGDFVDHFSWNSTKEHTKQSLEFITNMLKNYFSEIPVIPVLGNHDSHPQNCYAPPSVTDTTIGSQWLYNFLADQWDKWLPESALETFRKGGYYTLNIREGLRIIALNSNPCYTRNIWLLYETKSLEEQLQWLHDTLHLAESNHEKVHIVTHIPANTDSCIRSWDREFKKIIIRFSHIIVGQFNGHTHADEFSIFYSPTTSAALNVAFNGGSGTSLVGVNSNYRLYHADSENFEIIDHETWIFNLTEANQRPDTAPHWFKEYSFRELYGVDDLSPSTLHKMITDDWWTNTRNFLKYYRHTSKNSDVQKECNDQCIYNLWCRIVICPP